MKVETHQETVNDNILVNNRQKYKKWVTMTENGKMAARTDSVTRAPTATARFCCFCVFLVSLCTFCPRNANYTRQELIDIAYQLQLSISRDCHCAHTIPDDITRPAGSPWFVLESRKQHRRRREGGCRAGVLLRLRKQPHKSPLPSLYLTNARSIVHKTDYLELKFMIAMFRTAVL